MKLRLVLTTTTKNGKEVSIKFTIAPSKHRGVINYLNLALTQKEPVKLTFEKISKSGDKEESKVEGVFELECNNDQALKALTEQIEEKVRKRKKKPSKKIHQP
ncbi:MAG: hypothetical protein MUP85_19560 [Candidatus Lokiarchaeota archaeon]|nr:hypothetical protein [Candidatus Lokiarchaeota archaeon]